MDIRYSANQRDVKRYTTQELRDEFLIQNLYAANEVVAVYSHVDRMVTLGCMPTTETVSIDKGIDCWKNFGTHYFPKFFQQSIPLSMETVYGAPRDWYFQYRRKRQDCG